MQTLLRTMFDQCPAAPLLVIMAIGCLIREAGGSGASAADADGTWRRRHHDAEASRR